MKTPSACARLVSVGGSLLRAECRLRRVKIVAGIVCILTLHTWAADDVATTFPPVITGIIESEGNPIALDAAGNRYVVGYFPSGGWGSVDLNPGVGVDAKTGMGANDAFVTRLNADGSYGWTQLIGGSSDDEARGVAVSGGVVYVVGSFQSSDLGIGGTGSLAGSGGWDGFVAALDAGTGAAVTGFGTGGVQRIGGASDDYAYGVAVSGSVVYVVGDFQSSNFGVGGTSSIASSGGSDGFVAALNTGTGLPVAGFGTGGVQKIGGSSADYCRGVAVSGGVIYSCGYFSSTNLGVGGTSSIASSGGSDGFVAALNTGTGLPVAGFGVGGVRKIGGSSDDKACGVAVSGSVVYVVGSFQSSNLGVGGTGSVRSSGGWDGFVAALNTSTAAPIAGFGASGVQRIGGYSDDEAYAVAIDSGVVYVAGYFSSYDLGVGGSGTVTTTGYPDGFVAALNAGTGAAMSGFGTSGVQKTGGTWYDYCYGVAVGGGVVCATGPFSSSDLRVGGTGPASRGTYLNSFLVTLNATTGAVNAPQITSPLQAVAVVGVPFSYLLTTNQTINSSSASGLPNGLSFNSNRIRGTPCVPGTYPIVLTANCAGGTVYATIQLTVLTDVVATTFPPVIQGNIAREGNPIAVDATGNLYVVGSFSGAHDFNPGVGVDAKQSTDGYSDAFVSRFNADGSYGWTQVIGGSGDDYGNGVAVSGGVVYVTGFFKSNDLGIGGKGNVSSVGCNDGFVAALDATTGAAVASFGSGGLQKIGGLYDDYCSGVAVSGSVLYVAGSFYSANLGIGGAGSVASHGDIDGFVAALDAQTGAAIAGFGTSGVKEVGGGHAYCYGLAVGSGVVYVAGRWQTVYSEGFVAALDAGSGALVSNFGPGGIQTIYGTTDDDTSCNAVAVSGGVLYVSGSFFTYLDHLGVGGMGTLGTSGGYDGFVAALDAGTGAGVAGFGTGGIQKIGGSSDDYCYGVTVRNDAVYVCGSFTSPDLGVGGTGSLVSTGGSDGFVAALHPATGAPIAGFGTGGVQKIGGNYNDCCYGVVTNGTVLYTDGSFTSTNLGVGGPGRGDTKGEFYSFLVTLDRNTGSDRLPCLTSPLYVATGIGTPFSYLLTASQAIASSSAAGLPEGLSFSSGQITGTPSRAGVYNVVLTAHCSGGTVNGVLKLTVVADAVAMMYPPIVQGNDVTQNAMTMDAAGNRYLVGSFLGACDFNPGVGVDAKQSASDYRDVFVTRFNADGSYGWTQVLGGTGNEYGTGVVVSGGVVYVTGYFDSADFGVGGIGSLVSSGGYDGFVAALDAGTGVAVVGFGSGGLQKIGGSDDDYANGVAASGGVVYVCGYFYSGNLGVGGPGSVAPGDSGSNDGFVVALDAGTGVAVAGFGTSGIHTVGHYAAYRAIAVSGGVVYACGSPSVMALNAGTGAAVTGFGTNGQQVIGGSGYECAYAVAVSGSTVYVAGEFSGSNFGVGGSASLASSGADDGYVAALNAATGAAVAGFGTGGVQKIGGSGYDFARGVAVDGGVVYVCGYFSSNDLGIGGTGALGSSGADDGYVAALDAGTGVAVAGFGTGGVQKIGGSSEDHAYGVAARGSVYVCGISYSDNLGVGGLGPFSAIEFGSFMVPLDPSTGHLVTDLHFLVEAEGGGSIGPQTPDTPFSIRITARDGLGSMVTTFNGTVDVSSTGDLTLGDGTSGAFTNGVLASHAVKLSSAGTFVVTVRRTAGIENGCSNAFVVNTAPLFAQTDPQAVSCDKNGSPTAFGLSLDASDADGDTINWSITGMAEHGIACVWGTGAAKAISYTPDTDYFGADSFVVQIADGHGGAASLTVNVRVKDTPVLTWANPADIAYGTPLSGAQLRAKASVDGIYGYTPAAGTVLSVGNNQTLRVDFTPGDQANYNSTSATVTINVVKATPAITWANPASIVYGTPLSGTQLNATANTPGTFSYTPAAGTVLSAGNGQTLHVDFAPDDTANYNATSAAATINVVKATPKITWANPADIVYGNALSAAQLNATADIAGTFSYSPAAGAMLNVGDGQTLSESFVPEDMANYASASATATINVKPAVAPSITSALTASATQGSAFSYQITASGSTPMTFSADNFPAGLGVSGNAISGTPTVGGFFSVTLKATNAGGSDSKTLQITIAKPAGTQDTAPAISSPPHASSPTGATGQPATFTVSATDADGDGLGYTWDFGDGTTGSGANASHVYTTPGIYTVTVTISDGTATTQQQTDFVVSAGEAPVGDDNGGDDKWGTSGLDAFGITKVSLKLNFASGSKDALQLSGTIPVAKFFKPASKKVTVVIGGFKKDFPLNAKGQGTAGASKFQMKGKMKKGVFKATPAKFTLSIKGEPLLAALAEFGFANTTTSKTGEQIAIFVIIMVDTLGYEDDQTVLYKATAGKGGSGKLLGR